MNYQESTMKENTLEFIQKLFMKPIRGRLGAKIYIVYIFLIYVIQHVIFIHKALTSPNVATFVKYAPASLGSLFIAVLALNCIYIYHNGLEDYEKMVMDLRSIDSAGLRVKSRILRESHVIKNNFKFFIFIVTLATILFLPVVETGEDMWFLLKVFKENFESFACPLSLAFYATFPLVIVLTTLQAFLPLYFLKHGAFQMYMLEEFIGNISRKTDMYEMNRLYYNKAYQKRVKRKLIFCVKFHEEIKTYLKFGKNLLFFPIIIVYLCALLMTTTAMFLVSGSSLNISGYPRASLIVIILLLSFSAVIRSGQSIIDETTAVFETACKCPWYLWNNKNKKIYYFFLMNTVEPIQFSATNAIIITWSLVTKIVRKAFSFATILKQFTNPNTS